MPEIIYLRTEQPVSTQKVRDFLRTTMNFFALLDQDKLVSEVQILAAWEHVQRNRGKKVRDDATLLMLFLSGTSQISRAYELVGIRQSTRRIVIFYDDTRDLENFTDAFPEFSSSALSGGLPKDSPDNDMTVFSKISKVELELA